MVNRFPIRTASACLVAAIAAGTAAADPIDVASRPVPLDFGNAEVARVGALVYRGGLELVSEATDFGGFSGLLVSPDGEALNAVSDLGYLLSAEVRYDEAGRLRGLGEAAYALLPGLADRQAKTGRDAEAISADPEGGFLVAFEHEHRLWRYGDATGDPVPVVAPAEITQALANSGMEAMTRLADGRLLVISEGLHRGDGVAAWVRGAEGGPWQGLTYATAQGYQPTGAATLPNGDVLVVERRFPLISVRVRRVAAADIVPGATVEAEELARIEGSLAVDNFEAIDTRRGARGETLVYLMSDDNLNPLQKTYLLMFELAE